MAQTSFFFGRSYYPGPLSPPEVFQGNKNEVFVGFPLFPQSFFLFWFHLRRLSGPFVVAHHVFPLFVQSSLPWVFSRQRGPRVESRYFFFFCISMFLHRVAAGISRLPASPSTLVSHRLKNCGRSVLLFPFFLLPPDPRATSLLRYVVFLLHRNFSGFLTQAIGLVPALGLGILAEGNSLEAIGFLERGSDLSAFMAACPLSRSPLVPFPSPTPKVDGKQGVPPSSHPSLVGPVTWCLSLHLG